MKLVSHEDVEVNITHPVEIDYRGIRVWASSYQDFLDKIEAILLWRKQHGVVLP